MDSLKTARILRANHVTTASTVAIIGGNCYEHVCTFFAAMLLDAKVVLVESTASKGRQQSLARSMFFFVYKSLTNSIGFHCCFEQQFTQSMF